MLIVLVRVSAQENSFLERVFMTYRNRLLAVRFFPVLASTNVQLEITSNNKMGKREMFLIRILLLPI